MIHDTVLWHRHQPADVDLDLDRIRALGVTMRLWLMSYGLLFLYGENNGRVTETVSKFLCKEKFKYLVSKSIALCKNHFAVYRNMLSRCGLLVVMYCARTT